MASVEESGCLLLLPTAGLRALQRRLMIRVPCPLQGAALRMEVQRGRDVYTAFEELQARTCRGGGLL